MAKIDIVEIFFGASAGARGPNPGPNPRKI
jgi:hypothetical protein